MKKAFNYPILLLSILLITVSKPINAQISQTPELVGTAWKMVLDKTDRTTSDRTLIFRKNYSFETLTSNGKQYNGGKYYVTDDQSFITVHYGSQSANLYQYEIKNDTLRFKGNYIDYNFDMTDKKVGFYPIDEVWVKIPDWKDEVKGIKFSEFKTLDEALQKSAGEGKLIFMDCYTTWCGPCKYLSANIFTLKSVGDYFNEHFVNVKFDMESTEGRKIATKYGVKAYPTLLFINSKGEIEHLSIGCGGEEHLLHLAEVALDPENNLNAIKKKLDAGDRSAQTIIKYLSANNYANVKEKLLNEYFKNKTKAERLSEDSWKLFSVFDNNSESEQFKFFVKNRKDYEKKFGKKEVKNKIWDMLFVTMRDSVKYNAMKKVDPELFAKHNLYKNYRQAYNTFRTDKKNAENWQKLMVEAKKYFNQDSIDASEYNDVCWFIYENYKPFNDTQALKQAKEWSLKSYQMKPDEIQIMDTYAHILFETGSVDEAIQLEEEALNKATEIKNPSAKFFSEELEKFKAGKK